MPDSAIVEMLFIKRSLDRWPGHHLMHALHKQASMSSAEFPRWRQRAIYHSAGSAGPCRFMRANEVADRYRDGRLLADSVEKILAAGEANFLRAADASNTVRHGGPHQLEQSLSASFYFVSGM